MFSSRRIDTSMVVGRRAVRGEVVTEPLRQPSELMIVWGTVPGVFDYLISCEQCECPSRSDGPPWAARRICRRGVVFRGTVPAKNSGGALDLLRRGGRGKDAASPWKEINGVVPAGRY